MYTSALKYWYKKGKSPEYDSKPQQIKTFICPCDEEINQWLLENPQINIISINKIPMYDRYEYGQGDICNQWVETIIVYKEKL